jgi:polyisoprenoid-binding protein YceI
MPSRAVLALSAAWILGGCGGAADAQLVTRAPARVQPDGGLERYRLGPREVSLEAEVSAGASQTLRFGDLAGTLQLAPTRPEASSLELVVDIGSATSTIGAVADIAKARFLHADRYPEARVTTRSLRRAAAEADHDLVLYVDFTLHGTTRTLAVPADVQVTACRARLDCAFTFQRSDFGVVDDGNLEALVSDGVEIRVAIDVAREDAPAHCATTGP